MEAEPRGWHSPCKCDPHLPHRGHVEAESLFHHPPCHCPAQQCLARVVDTPVGETVTESAGTSPEILLIDQVGGRAVTGGDLRQCDAPDHNASLCITLGPCGP